MSVLEAKASECSDFLHNNGVDKKTFQDLSYILILIEIITEIFKIVKECKKSESKMLETIRSPRMTHRIMVNRLTRRILKEKGVYDKIPSHLVLDSLLAAGKTMTEAEYGELVK